VVRLVPAPPLLPLRRAEAHRVEVLELKRFLLLIRDGLRSVLSLEAELVHLLLEEGLACVPTFGGGELEEELFVALDDDGETVMTETESLLRLKGDDILDRNNHLRKGRREETVQRELVGERAR
jgi:hypothetical protein